MQVSANLGFLWADGPLPDAIRAAKAAGFDAVECHWPYDVPADAVAAALSETGLVMLGLNTRRGNPGENGLAALPGRGAEARAAVDEALAYAEAIGTPNIHVMAGFAEGPEAEAAFLETLRYACDRAGARTILIEPLNRYDAPGYFLKTTGQAEAIIGQVGAPNLKLMFDCYHVQLTEGDVTHRLERLLPLIGHVQVASVPDRAAPDHGELNYPHVWEVLQRIGWAAPIGAEYKPGGDTDATLGWLSSVQGKA
jgi:hydroxypyruvate isomerase